MTTTLKTIARPGTIDEIKGKPAEPGSALAGEGVRAPTPVRGDLLSQAHPALREHNRVSGIVRVETD